MLLWARKIEFGAELELRVRTIVSELISRRGVYRFLFGSRSEFNELCYKVVTELRKTYPQIERVYVRAEYPIIDERYREYLLGLYEDTYYPSRIVGAGRSVYVQRNSCMINESAYCICYYDVGCIAESKNGQASGGSKSGTKIAYEYARKKKREIYNVARDGC